SVKVMTASSRSTWRSLSSSRIPGISGISRSRMSMCHSSFLLRSRSRPSDGLAMVVTSQSSALSSSLRYERISGSSSITTTRSRPVAVESDVRFMVSTRRARPLPRSPDRHADQHLLVVIGLVALVEHAVAHPVVVDHRPDHRRVDRLHGVERDGLLGAGRQLILGLDGPEVAERLLVERDPHTGPDPE